jgi:membrane protein implicated in regulation of membrane protease activity
MADYWIWWVLAAALVGLELVTGTFYLLAVGVAFALGGLAAVLGASLPIQLLIGGVAAVAGTIAAHQWRKGHAMPAPQDPASTSGRKSGAVVARQRYGARHLSRNAVGRRNRGAPRTARADHVIVGTRGSTLVVAASKP